MDLTDYVAEALELVLARELPDELCPHLLQAEAARLAGRDAEEVDCEPLVH